MIMIAFMVVIMTTGDSKQTNNANNYRIPKICVFAHNAKFDQNFFMTQLKPEIFGSGPDGIKFSGDSVNTY